MDHYTVSQSSKVQEAEKDLNNEIIELQNEIENISFQENGSSKSLTYVFLKCFLKLIIIFQFCNCTTIS